MDRGVNQKSRKDGALVTVSPRWNANPWLYLPRQAPVHNPYYFALLFYACALIFKVLNEKQLHIYPYPMSPTSMLGSCRLLC